MNLAFVTIIGAILGLSIGSFMNVVVYRVPRALSVVRPGSMCPTCGHEISARDNIPLVSWILLGGKCRHCKTQISVRYPLVEAAFGVVGALLALGVFNAAS